ncbi:MAG: hypothetical protein DWQ44_11370 [Bacteroidetes bacterium]|nr:MAG: hypothetical protein DWQ33_09490 [Bacteroidota bacterium]REK05221.1 MAG: hypothetical protein DWQ39_08500 [Bacteroidota bacterium]REK32626.1 MAG: hypothetical protein DWQ44_11370 [Bacteroidota bacterium]REK48927.1 MAG: hypothetical protein DWQ48_08590 [Bacteroidota bacterium]
MNTKLSYHGVASFGVNSGFRIKGKFTQELFPKLLLIFCLLFSATNLAISQTPLSASVDSNCTTKACSPAQLINCIAGVIVTGGIPLIYCQIFEIYGLVANTGCGAVIHLEDINLFKK